VILFHLNSLDQLILHKLLLRCGFKFYLQRLLCFLGLVFVDRLELFICCNLLSLGLGLGISWNTTAVLAVFGDHASSQVVDVALRNEVRFASKADK